MKRRDILRAGSALGALWGGDALALPRPRLRQLGLIIGNADYRNVGRLANPSHDARLMQTTLDRLGVECTCLTDCTNARMGSAVQEFLSRVGQAPVGLVWFYFSGHGVYLRDRNIMLGVDTVADSETSLLAQGFDLDALRGMLHQALPDAAVLVEDACRNDPFLMSGPSSTRGIAVNPGLIPRRWGGTLTAYSTAPFTEAMDWPTRPNGPYATALSRALLQGGNRPIEDVFRAVADAVWTSTRHRQVPGYYSDLRTRVWLDGGRLSVHPGAAPDIGRAGSRGTRGLGHYQAGLEAAPPMGQPLTWEQDFRRLTNVAQSLDDQQTRHAIASGRRPGASVMEQTLGAMMLETYWPERRALDQAQELFLRAARRGYVPAQVFLGELAYRRRNYALAYSWLHLAAQEGSTRAELDVDNMLVEEAMLSGQPNAVQQGYQQYRQAEQAALQGISRLLRKAMTQQP